MSDFQEDLEREIQRAAEKIERTWPLYAYVTSNPLSGLEDKPFDEAISEARALFGGRGYPSAWQFRQALQNDRIDPSLLRTHLSEEGLNPDIHHQLQRLEDRDEELEHDQTLGSAKRSLNQILEKWLSSFLDEGQSRWSMPDREQGFYEAWKRLGQVDHQIPDAGQLGELPENKHDALENVLADVPPKDRRRVFTYHLAALPGWVGYIKQRNQREDDEWSERYPIDLTDYLAVRLILADQLGATIVPDPEELDPRTDALDAVRRCFLEAWEETYRSQLTDRLKLEATERKPADSERPDAQFVFCIDTRSEIIRRHIEGTGNYETHGYAGFFGVPVRHRPYGKSTSVDSCPPIVQAQHAIEDVPRESREHELDRLKSWTDFKNAARKSLKNIQDNVASAFSYVEFSGLFYGFNILKKTLFPESNGLIRKQFDESAPDYHEVTKPELDGKNPDSEDIPQTSGMTLRKKVQYARSAFELMGWTSFAPVVVFVGHSSQTTNNPFDSSLRCGACSGNSGTPNARILASICNDPEVREKLRDDGLDIPEDTIFVAGHHNTTTDRITLLADEVSEDHPSDLDSIKEDLEEARKQAAAERLESMPDADTSDAIRATEQRASDWAQTRPEWGLAGNASFLVGPNRLRDSVDLEGRAFLHSYDWEEDPDGSALEQIFEGPVVVCQWINHQYYFSSVDNRTYGSGSKITHNPVGNFGVLQGNGGALMGGLPLQSLMESDTKLRHEPLRILTVVHAPYQRVSEILERNDTVRRLVENNWIALEVIDPTRNNEVIRFGKKIGEPESQASRENVTASV